MGNNYKMTNDEKKHTYTKGILSDWMVPREIFHILEKKKYDVLSINPYLLQNRFSCKFTEKKKTSDKQVPLLYVVLETRAVPGDKFCNKELTTIAKALNKRNQKLVELFVKHECYAFEPYDKMMIGEGGGLYLGMQPLKLHPLYGLPYIPASAMKGAFRSAWTMVFEMEKKSEKDDFRKLFGAAGNGQKTAEDEDNATEGNLVFFDIFPEQFTMGLDIQSIHYKDYYDSTKPPTDNMNVQPIPFVCLTRAKFNILLACRDDALWERNKQKIDEILDVVFHQIGIGAKTALGYGIV